jgi:hypothetical protein
LVFENLSKAFVSSPSAMLLDLGSLNRPRFQVKRRERRSGAMGARFQCFKVVRFNFETLKPLKL